MADQPQMLVEEFEETARRAAETVRLEFIHGKLGAKAVPDGDHRQIINWFMKICVRQRPELGLYPECALKVEAYRGGRALADFVLAPEGAFAGPDEWADPDAALVAVEVTSYDSDTNRRDRVEKPRAYAQAGIPMYVLIDRDACEAIVFTGPENGIYTTTVRYSYGKTVELPAPVSITLDTEPLKEWVR